MPRPGYVPSAESKARRAERAHMAVTEHVREHRRPAGARDLTARLGLGPTSFGTASEMVHDAVDLGLVQSWGRYGVVPAQPDGACPLCGAPREEGR